MHRFLNIAFLSGNIAASFAGEGGASNVQWNETTHKNLVKRIICYTITDILQLLESMHDSMGGNGAVNRKYSVFLNYDFELNFEYWEIDHRG